MLCVMAVKCDTSLGGSFYRIQWQSVARSNYFELFGPLLYQFHFVKLSLYFIRIIVIHQYMVGNNVYSISVFNVILIL